LDRYPPKAAGVGRDARADAVEHPDHRGGARRRLAQVEPAGQAVNVVLQDIAARLRADTLAAIERAGFAENFDPVTGEGGGGSSFSWTAAAYLVLAGPAPPPPASTTR
jgi:Mannosylglycerate hydrolase MGH1-like glycoside hydrolase domain